MCLCTKKNINTQHRHKTSWNSLAFRSITKASEMPCQSQVGNRRLILLSSPDLAVPSARKLSRSHLYYIHSLFVPLFAWKNSPKGCQGILWCKSSSVLKIHSEEELIFKTVQKLCVNLAGGPFQGFYKKR